MTRSNLLAVVLWMGGALVSFSAVAVSVRELSGYFGVFEMLALRNAAGIVILLALALLRPGLRVALAPRRVKLHLFRNGAHFLGNSAWTYGVTLLPLATVFAIEFTTPVWVALLAVLLLGERMTAPRLAAVALGFLGVLVVVRPNPWSLDPAALIVLGSAFAFALTSVATKELTRTETTFAILFWMNVMQLPMNLVGSDPKFVLRLAEAPLLPVAGICLSSLAAHFCLTNAYHHGDATIVVPLDFLRIPLIALVGFWLYREPLDPYVFAGAALIVAGIVWNLRAEATSGNSAPVGIGSMSDLHLRITTETHPKAEAQRLSAIATTSHSLKTLKQKHPGNDEYKEVSRNVSFDANLATLGEKFYRLVKLLDYVRLVSEGLPQSDVDAMTNPIVDILKIIASQIISKPAVDLSDLGIKSQVVMWLNRDWWAEDAQLEWGATAAKIFVEQATAAAGLRTSFNSESKAD